VPQHFCPISTKSGFYRQIFIKVSNTKFQGHLSCGSHADICRRTDMTKLIGAFHDYANAPKTVANVDNVPFNFFTAARTCYWSALKVFTRPDVCAALYKFFVIRIIRILTMKTEKFQRRGNNSVCAEAFQLLRGRPPAQLRGNSGCRQISVKTKNSSCANTEYRIKI
jgi:hypothetical protein